MATKIFFCLLFFCLLVFEGTFSSFFKDKMEVIKSTNHGFSYYFCLMTEGSRIREAQKHSDPDPQHCFFSIALSVSEYPLFPYFNSILSCSQAALHWGKLAAGECFFWQELTAFCMAQKSFFDRQFGVVR
jgi:hypothetical protein